MVVITIRTNAQFWNTAIGKVTTRSRFTWLTKGRELSDWHLWQKNWVSYDVPLVHVVPLLNLRLNFELFAMKSWLFKFHTACTVHPGLRSGLAPPLTVRKDERTAGVRVVNSKLSGFVAFFNVKLIFRCWHASEQFFRVDIPIRNLDYALGQPAK